MRMLLIALLALSAGSATAADQAARRLHMDQQQQALELRLRQSNAARSADLSPSDQRRLDQLHLQQRMEQGQLEIQQTQRDRALRQSTSGLDPHALDPQADAQRRLFATERELQNQRFELDRQRLLQSAPRQPLQPPLGIPQLELR